MKAKLLFAFALVLCVMSGRAQAPQEMNYQAIVRNSAGTPLDSATVELKFIIHDSSSTGANVYSETHSSLMTNRFGLVTVQIGSSTSLSPVNWGSGPEYLEVQQSFDNGLTYTSMGNSQLISVPYAFYAANSATGPTGPSGNSGVTGLTGSTGPTGPGSVNGTLNYVAKFTPDGSSLGNSTIFDTGAGVGIEQLNPRAELDINAVSGGGGQTALNLNAAGNTMMTVGVGGASVMYLQHYFDTTFFYNYLAQDISFGASQNIEIMRLYAPGSSVGIGTSVPNAKLQVVGHGAYAGYFSTDSLYELAHVIDGEYLGVGGADGIGVYGYSHPADDYGFGGYFSGTWIGVHADALVNGGALGYYGVISEAGVSITGTDTGALVYGIYAATTANAANDYAGNFSAVGGNAVAVYGQADDSHGYTISRYWGGSENTSIWGQMNYSQNTFFSSGVAAITNNAGVTSTAGLFAAAEVAPGTHFTGNAYGIFTEVYDTADGYAVGIYSDVSHAASVHDTDFVKAGYFVGNVEVLGTLTAGAKNFKIDHPLDPENKYLVYTCPESPEMLNIYTGNVTTGQNGLATVTLPDYYDAININTRIQLTVNGVFAQVIVKEKENNNHFVIQTDKPNVEIDWMVTGVRNDKFARAHRTTTEVQKKGPERGRYLYPELYGKSGDYAMPVTAGRLANAGSGKFESMAQHDIARHAAETPKRNAAAQRPVAQKQNPAKPVGAKPTGIGIAGPGQKK